MALFPIRLVETTPPGAEPVTLDEAKAHLRLVHDSEDETVRGLIAAARQACEDFTGRALIARGYSLFLDQWPAEDRGGGVQLPRPPMLSVSGIYVYADDDTALEFPAAGYFVDAAAMPARVVLRAAVSPPLPLRVASGIEIRYRAGYGAAPDAVPAALRTGMKQMIAHLYARRGDDSGSALKASGAAALFHPYRVMQL